MKSAQKILEEYFIGQTFINRAYHEEEEEKSPFEGLKIKSIWIGQDESREDGVIHIDFVGGKHTWVYGNEGILIRPKKRI